MCVCTYGWYKRANFSFYIVRGFQKTATSKEIKVDIYTLHYIKYITNKNLLFKYSTGNSTQYAVTYMEKESKRVDICIIDSLCCTAETNITLFINHILIKIHFKNEKRK